MRHGDTTTSFHRQLRFPARVMCGRRPHCKEILTFGLRSGASHVSGLFARHHGERGDRTNSRHGHEPADLGITARQLHNLAVKLTDLLLDGIARCEQRSDRSYKLRTTLDQLLGSHGEDIELGTRPMTRPRSFRRPRTWFSRSRLILTSSARLASSALTEWLSIALTWTSLNQPGGMMRAIPIGAPNVLASSRAPAQAGIEIIDVTRTNNVLIGNPFGFPDNYVAIRMPHTGKLWRN